MATPCGCEQHCLVIIAEFIDPACIASDFVGHAGEFVVDDDDEIIPHVLLFTVISI